MKKVIVCFLLVGLFSCSKSDPEPLPIVVLEHYSITIKPFCDNAPEEECNVVKDTYEIAKQKITSSSAPCKYFTFNTISNEPKKGYLVNVRYW